MVHIQKNNEGFILVTCLVMLVVLTIVGFIATRTSTLELRTSANTRDAKSVFYVADSGIYTAPKTIRRAIVSDPTDVTTISIGSMAFTDPANGSTEAPLEFRRKIYGFNPAIANIGFPIANDAVNVDIFRSGQELLPGGSTEFASGYEGVGHGSLGGVAILYALTSNGQAQNNSQTQIDALYRFIPGTAGGL